MIIPRKGGYINHPEQSSVIVDLLIVGEPFFGVFSNKAYKALHDRADLYETCDFAIRSKKHNNDYAVIIDRVQ